MSRTKAFKHWRYSGLLVKCFCDWRGSAFKRSK